MAVKTRDSYIYPPGGQSFTQTIPAAGGSAFSGDGAQDWYELTDEFMGAINDPQSRAASLTYDAGTGWTVTWNAGGTTDDDDVDNAPSRIMELGEIAPADFDFDNYGVDLLVRSSVAELNQTSPYQTGLGVAIVTDNRGNGTGPALLSNNGTVVSASILQSGNMGSISTNNDFIALQMFIRKGPSASAGLSSHNTRYPDNDTVVDSGTSSLVDGGTLAITALDGLSIGIFAPVNTTTNLAAHSQTARIYIRITPLKRFGSLAEIKAGP